MGNLLSRAIKRFTQCNSGDRNQLASSSQIEGANREQAATTARSLDRPSSEAIPVGQSIDSAEYAAFKTAPSSIDRNNRDNSANTSQNNEQVESLAETAKYGDQEIGTGSQDAPEGELAGPQVEEAVIKIQALVRGHLTRKALKDAHQHQHVPLNVLGQSQFDEKSLSNPPNMLFSNVSPPPLTNTSNPVRADDNQQQAGSKLANGRMPPLESIAEDVESINAATPSTRAKRRLSSAKSRPSNSASDTIDEFSGSQSPTSPSNEANASIDIHCDTPTSASIDIMDHSSGPMAAIATVLHQHSTSRVEAAGSSDQQQQPREANSYNNVELHNGSGRLGSSMSALLNEHHQVHPTSASSVPSTPPHINLALTTNSHSIDSAEAAAIRIQSAFRGYHTRKHSPYRRRSPGDVTSTPAALINGATPNGQPKRSTLRQQNATILDDDELASGQDQEMDIENLEPMTSEEIEERRQSRMRHRLDETRSGDLPQEEPIGATESTSLDGPTISATNNATTTATLAADDCQLTTREAQRGETSPGSNVLSDVTNRAVLIGAEIDQQSQEKSSKVESDGRPEANQGPSLETDSSYLGAALSLNEDPSEGLSQASNGHDAQPDSLKRDSLGAVLESSSDGDASIDQEEAHFREQAVKKQLEELDRVTDQLEAALDEATDYGTLTPGDQLAAGETSASLSDEKVQQNLNELESDDVERRHPSGLVAGELPRSYEQQAALVASNSLDNQEVDIKNEQQLARLDIPQARLEAVSPDEAIGSGGSSPALVESHDGNSTDDGADSDQEQDGQPRQLRDDDTKREDNQQSAGGSGNRSAKKRRNRRRGKK